MGCCCQKVAATRKTQRSKSSAESSINHESDSSHLNNSKKRRRTRGLSVLGTSSATSVATPRRPGEEQLFTTATSSNESVNTAMGSSGIFPVAPRTNAAPKAAAAQGKLQERPLDGGTSASNQSGNRIHRDAVVTPLCVAHMSSPKVLPTELERGGVSPGLEGPVVSPSTTEDHRLHHSVFALATSPSAQLLVPPSLAEEARGLTAPEWRCRDDGDAWDDMPNRNTRGSTL